MRLLPPAVHWLNPQSGSEVPKVFMIEPKHNKNILQARILSKDTIFKGKRLSILPVLSPGDIVIVQTTLLTVLSLW